MLSNTRAVLVALLSSINFFNLCEYSFYQSIKRHLVSNTSFNNSERRNHGNRVGSGYWKFVKGKPKGTNPAIMGNSVNIIICSKWQLNK